VNTHDEYLRAFSVLKGVHKVDVSEVVDANEFGRLGPGMGDFQQPSIPPLEELRLGGIACFGALMIAN
jgi:hypothetical protein